MFTNIPRPSASSPLSAIQGNYAFGDGNPNTVTTITYSLAQYLDTGAWTPSLRAQFKMALDVIESVANINFVETSIASADLIEVVAPSSFFSRPSILGFHQAPVAGGSTPLYGAFNTDYWNASNGAPGGYFFTTILHELGHALGLGHPHDDGLGSSVMAGVTQPFDSFGVAGLNQGIFTVMSYNDGWTSQNGILPLSATSGGSTGLGALDIAALQAMYGANTSTNSGNNTYTLDAVNAAGTGYQSIWDTGGIDTLAHIAGNDAVLDLRPATLDYSATGGGAVSSASGVRGGYTIAHGVVIENASGGSGNDIIFGNLASNVLSGNAGNDVFYSLSNGYNGNTINGGSGNDVIYVAAGAGADVVNGGGDNDIAVVSSNGGSFIGGSGFDTIRFVYTITDYLFLNNGTTFGFTNLINGVTFTVSNDVETFQFSNGLQGFTQAGVMQAMQISDIETNGTVLQHAAHGIYVLDGGSDNIALKLNGQVIGQNSLAGWSAIQAEETATGFRLLWQNVNGTYSEWTLNSQGEATGGSNVANVVDLETVYGADLNGDNNIGHITTTVESAGDVTLQNSTQTGYIIDGKNLTWNNQNFGPNTLPGWTVIQAEAFEIDSYKVLLQNTDGTYVEWILDSSGAYVSGAVASNVYDLETFYGVDLNNDSAVGHVTTTVENAGSVTLQNATQTGYIIDGDKQLTYNGQNIGPNTLPGWTALQAEAITGGYKVLLKNTDGTYVEWTLDSAGGYVAGEVIGNVVDVETFYGADIDGDNNVGHVVTNIETNGSVNLAVSTQDTYVVDGTKTLTWNGQNIGPNTLPGWTALQAEAFGGGYKVLLQNTDGTYVEWTLDSSGAYVDGATASNVYDLEAFYGVDLNTDSTVGHVTTSIESAGAITLQSSTQTGYIIDGDKQLTYNGQNIGPNTLPGWTALQAEAVTGGYKVLLKNTDGTYVEWTLNGTGEYVAGEVIGNVADVETFYGADIDGDNNVGHVVVSNIETNGSVNLDVSAQDTYVVDGTKTLTWNGQNIGPNTLPGWTALHAEAFGGGYKVLLQNTDGTYVEWTLNSSGAYLSGEIIPDVIDVEDFYQYDINGSGTVGYALPKFAQFQKQAPIVDDSDEIHFVEIQSDAPMETDQEMIWNSLQRDEAPEVEPVPSKDVDVAGLGLLDDLLNDDVFLI
ncbi:matrixin family metalloprotease [uncultured Ruegeria sp.]|uniref:matrixin family metalloprotease n=1 Tax=uncultured Ruegeria sp. TaxID=259304 RepID=UPI0026046C91|nr:matrixin family metalloprotease [uncultured Ruegeria sp.]